MAIPDGLAARLVAGDVGVVRELYKTYGRLMFAVAYRVLDNRILAEEATQEAFLQAWRARSSFDVSRDVRPWLCTIAHRAAIDVRRREARQFHIDLDAASHRDEMVSHPDFDAAWATWRVREAVDELPDDERTVVRLQHFEGHSLPEIASGLGVPLGTVKSRTHRAHRRLAAALSGLRREVVTADE